MGKVNNLSPSHLPWHTLHYEFMFEGVTRDYKLPHYRGGEKRERERTGDGVRVLSGAENHLGSRVHHQPITHEAEAAAQRGQRAAVIGHIPLLTLLLTANQVRSGGSIQCALSEVDLFSTGAVSQATF